MLYAFFEVKQILFLYSILISPLNFTYSSLHSLAVCSGNFSLSLKSNTNFEVNIIELYVL